MPPMLSLQTDRQLLAASGTLLLLGLIMVASTTVNLAQQQWQSPLYLFWRQMAYAGAGVGLALVAALVPVATWRKLSVGLLLLGLSLLLLVLIPGIGREVNGSMRWISLGAFNMQPSEPMKLAVILYLAGYLVRRKDEVRAELSGSLKPLAVLMLITGLLLLEPDYGAVVVLFATVMGMLFLAGVPLRQFGLWALGVSLALIGVVLLAPYRVQRLATFMNPWEDPFDRGFQLTQALIAIGRGEWFGVGLGSSVQKLAYLPEAHTDFLFAILAEELGLFGGALVIGLFALVVWRAFAIARRAREQEACYAAYLAYGIGLCIGLQAGINLGVNMGLLPTKGLPLPFMSYGGSNMLINCVMIALLWRVDYESRPRIKQII
jgi:cell division protein FtsW